MTTTAAPLLPQSASVTPPRLAALDALRGAAVVLMVLDHVLMVWLPLDAHPVRSTVTRVAMPLFAVLAGHLARRLSWRLVWVAFLGLACGVLFPFAGVPSILWQLATACACLVVLRALATWADWPPVLAPLVMLALALTRFGNGYAADPTGGYPIDAVLGLVALGALVPRECLTWPDRLPAGVTAPLAAVGRFPLTAYVGHLALIAAAVAVFGA